MFQKIHPKGLEGRKMIILRELILNLGLLNIHNDFT